MSHASLAQTTNCYVANVARQLLPAMTFANIREVVKAAVNENCAASAIAKVSADHCLRQAMYSMAVAN